MNCYDLPQYWDLAFSEDTAMEADFVLQAVKKYCSFEATTLYEPGCGGGRLVVELAKRGMQVIGVDGSQAAIDYAESQLQAADATADLFCGDMTTFVSPTPIDAAYCLVNTFRHLLTEEAALAHLKCVAGQLRDGGLYVLGLHMFPPDADTEDSENWSVTEDDVTVDMHLDVADCRRETRLETLKFQMSVTTKDQPEVRKFHSDYRMRLYEADQMLELLNKVPEFELVGVYDFWYDLDEPLELCDDLGDTVLVLRKKPE